MNIKNNSHKEKSEKKERIKILMLGWEYPPIIGGGLGIATRDLTKHLTKKNIDITLILPYAPKNFKTHVKIISTNNLNILTLKEIKELIKKNLVIHGYTNIEEYNRKIYLIENNIKEENEDLKLNKKIKELYGKNLFEEIEKYTITIEHIIKKITFDIIHAHDWMTYKAGIKIKEKTGKKLVLHIHATEYDRTGGNNINSYVYNIEKEGFEKADRIIAVSNYTKNILIEKYGISPEKIEVAHNGIETEETKIEEINLGELKNKNYLLFLGRITLQKGPEYFIEAAKKVLEVKKDAYFVFAGTGDKINEMIKKTIEYGINKNFYFFNRQVNRREVYTLFKNARAYILSSVSEPFGITPLEAIAVKTPVIISKQSGVSEVLQNVLKVDFWDINKMAHYMANILKHDPLKETLSEHSYEELKKISWEKTAEKVKNIYEKLL